MHEPSRARATPEPLLGSATGRNTPWSESAAHRELGRTPQQSHQIDNDNVRIRPPHPEYPEHAILVAHSNPEAHRQVMPPSPKAAQDNPGTSRTRACQHDVAVHVRVLGLPGADTAPGAGRDAGRGAGSGRGGFAVTRRTVGYQWRLREIMAAHGIFATTDLVGPLRERGIEPVAN